MQKQEIIIGLYHENKDLRGYKTDTFWTLSKKEQRAKTHRLVENKIEPHLINNLGAACRRDQFGDFDSMLVGYTKVTLDKETNMYTAFDRPKFTHRAFHSEVQELDAEDLERLNSTK